MKCYSDSSFIGQLLITDCASAGPAAAFRRCGRPTLPFSQFHELEITNALRFRVFTAAGSAQRATARREAVQGFRKLHHLLTIRCLERVPIDWPDVFSTAMGLSASHAEKTGARALDTLHVAAALLLHSEMFLTCDRRQAKLAKAVGLSVTLVA